MSSDIRDRGLLGSSPRSIDASADGLRPRSFEYWRICASIWFVTVELGCFLIAPLSPLTVIVAAEIADCRAEWSPASAITSP